MVTESFGGNKDGARGTCGFLTRAKPFMIAAP